MKIGPFEGTTDEFREFNNLISVHGSNLNDYIRKLPAAPSTRYIVMPLVGYVVVTLSMLVIPGAQDGKLATGFCFVAAGLALWAAVNLFLRYENKTASAGVFIILMLLIVFCAGDLTFGEVLEYVKALRASGKG